MAKKQSRKKTGKKRTASRAPRVTKSAGGLSMQQLIAELRRRERDLGKLQSRRDKLASELDSLDNEIAEIAAVVGGSATSGPRRGRPRGRPARGVTASGAPRRRPQNSQTLEDALAGALKGRTMGVSEAADAVLSGGYQTSAENFRTIVNQTLIRSDRFKKVARGQYTAA